MEKAFSEKLFINRSEISAIVPLHPLQNRVARAILLALVLYILKTKVSFFWFINVPALYISMRIANYMWLTSLKALIKFLVIRTIGIKKYEEYATPIVAGWILGFGALWLPAALINMGTVVFPKMQTMFQP